MQYGNSLATKLTIREDWTVGISSAQHGANLNAVGFNLSLISRHDPKLATAILDLYRQACELNLPTQQRQTAKRQPNQSAM